MRRTLLTIPYSTSSFVPLGSLILLILILFDAFSFTFNPNLFTSKLGGKKPVALLLLLLLLLFNKLTFPFCSYCLLSVL
uniref:Ovule protein n=1 Tax=Caenorhabditis tropicalis TaxID=1561998 RepID=A0A1I7TKT1_9PELO